MCSVWLSWRKKENFHFWYPQTYAHVIQIYFSWAFCAVVLTLVWNYCRDRHVCYIHNGEYENNFAHKIAIYWSSHLNSALFFNSFLLRILIIEMWSLEIENLVWLVSGYYLIWKICLGISILLSQMWILI